MKAQARILVSHLEGSSISTSGKSVSPFLTLWRESKVETILFCGLISGLAWAPFWLGSNRLFAWGVNGILFPALVAFYEMNLILAGEPHPVGLRRLRTSALMSGSAVLWIALQMQPLALASLAHPIWGMAGEALGRSLEPTISVNHCETYIALIRLLTSASLFWLTLQFSRRAMRADLLLQAICVIVAVYVAYGLVLSAFFSGVIPLFDPVGDRIFVHATFVNRNNFATYAGLGLIVCEGLTLRLFRKTASKSAGNFRHRLASFFETAGKTSWFLLGVGIVILAAILGTGSRGGALATALGVLSLPILSLFRRRERGTERLAVMVLVSASFIASFFFLGDLVVDRLMSEGLQDASRNSVYLITLRSITDAPLLGFGYGTFADLFPMYRDQSISVMGVWDKAHNAYLEVFHGLGLVFGSALIASLGVIAAECFKGAITRRKNTTPAMVASAATVLVAVHSLVDFSLQIEAVALTYLAILAVGYAQSDSSRLSLSD